MVQMDAQMFSSAPAQSAWRLESPPPGSGAAGLLRDVLIHRVLVAAAGQAKLRFGSAFRDNLAHHRKRLTAGSCRNWDRGPGMVNDLNLSGAPCSRG
jgi:hypothetical protein